VKIARKEVDRTVLNAAEDPKPLPRGMSDLIER